MVTVSRSTQIAAVRRAACLAARDVLADYPHLSTPERLRADGILEDIAYDRGARVEYGELSGADGRLIRASVRSVIRVRATDEPGRRAFTLAHELGHLVLEHGGCGVAALCSEASTGIVRSTLDEAAAHSFAAELLMPEAMCRPLCSRCPPDLGVAAEIAARFRTSLVASARRMVELSDVACAVIYSEGGSVAWSRRSRAFSGFVRTGHTVSAGSRAAACSTGSDVSGPTRVPARLWDARAPDGAELIEHSRHLDGSTAVLTLLISGE